MASTVLQNIIKRAQELGQAVQKTKDAIEWFKTKAANLRNAKINDMMSGESKRFLKATKIGKRQIGAMVMFFYDPKWKHKLPYYDRFPLVFPIELYNDGFLGINLHYLSPRMRAQLLDVLYEYQNKTQKDDAKRLIISYKILKGAAKARAFRPCIKRYLYSHVRSRFYVVGYSEWNTVIFMPLERFEKKSKTYVWAESAKKANQ